MLICQYAKLKFLNYFTNIKAAALRQLRESGSVSVGHELLFAVIIHFDQYDGIALLIIDLQ